MGNTNIELDQRIQKLERQLEAFRTTIEPKSWEFIWQHWYNTATEVLNVWNWKQFTPAYGNSIIKDLEWFETRLTQTENTIQFDVVQNDEVISKINLSSEWIRIRWAKITIDWTVTFASWYNPSTKITTWWAASDINTYTTTISGGKITTWSITADRMNVSSLSAISANIWTITAGTITWVTINTFINPTDLVASHMSAWSSKWFWIDKTWTWDLIQITASDYLWSWYVGKINFYKTWTFQWSIFWSNWSIQIDESNLTLWYWKHLYVWQSWVWNAYFWWKLQIPVWTNLY